MNRRSFGMSRHQGGFSLIEVMIAILVLGGAQMLTLGVFGEYLWRILVQVQRRSPYVIEQVLPLAAAKTENEQN